MNCNKTKLWIKHFPNLFCDYKIIPTDRMSLSEQMNAITRLIFFIFFILSCLNYTHSILFLLISLLIIIILYYIQKKNMEMFRPKENFLNSEYGQFSVGYGKPNNGDNSFFCAKNLQQGVRQKRNPTVKDYSGGANPKTLIKPIIKARSHDLEMWRTNNSVQHSSVNNGRIINDARSGYSFPTKNQPTEEVREKQFIVLPHQQPFRKEKKSIPYEIIEGGQYTQHSNIDDGLPFDLETNVHIADPNVHIYIKENETINSNNGISYYPSEKTYIKYKENGNTIYEEVEKSAIEPDVKIRTEPTYSDVYDPRHNGYGTSYRSYTDKTFNNVKHYYDDIDNVKFPKLIERNNIDMVGNIGGSCGARNVRDEIHRHYNDSVIQQRDNVRLSLKSKTHHRDKQLKDKPLRI